MKYLITESKLEETIMNYFDELFDIQELNWTHPYEYDDEAGEEGDDENRIEFYKGDYSDMDTCFRYYKCGYFNANSPSQEICPEVSVEHPYSSTLTGYFGNMWQEPFKKWIKINFDLPVKTVDYI